MTYDTIVFHTKSGEIKEGVTCIVNHSYDRSVLIVIVLKNSEYVLSAQTHNACSCDDWDYVVEAFSEFSDEETDEGLAGTLVVQGENLVELRMRGSGRWLGSFTRLKSGWTFNALGLGGISPSETKLIQTFFHFIQEFE